MFRSWSKRSGDPSFFRINLEYDKKQGDFMREKPIKKLIINIDDAGLSRAVNAAVKTCFIQRVATGVSVMACGKYFNEAAGLLRGLKMTEVGAHLVLTDGFSPCAGKDMVRSLLRPDGTFYGGYKSFILRLVAGGVDMSHIDTELRCQLERIKKEGLTVTHIDSHQHIHVFPWILERVLKLALEYGIPYVRIPLEESSVANISFSAGGALRHFALKIFLPGAAKAAKRYRIAYNDAFLGHFHAGNIDDRLLCAFVSRLKNGITELAVHPGERSAELEEISPWHKNAPVELDALLNGEWRKLIQANDIRLVTHKEAIG